MRKFLFPAVALFCLGGAFSAAGSLAFIPLPKEIVASEGVSAISSASTIFYSDDSAKDVAEVLADDLRRLFALELAVRKGSEAGAGDVVLMLSPAAQLASEEYFLKAGAFIGVQASEIGGLHAGTATLIQALAKDGEKIAMPQMEIKDQPSREFRAHMVDMKNQWHSIADLKKFVDMCRWYKVRYLSLHSGEDQWIGALLTQTGTMTAEERQKHRLYSKEEMDDLIAYAKKRGVYMLPHNECTPSFNHMKNAMRKDYNPSDDFAGFPDELDGEGSFENFEGKADERWLKLMEILIDRGIDQFAAGYPDGKLPYYHVGPIFGEGGMSSELGVKILKMIEKKSPGTQMMFWNGLSANDQHLAPHKEKCVVAYYDDEFGQSDMESYLKAGWPTVNSAWSPLYVVGQRLSRPVENVYRDWNVTRQGSDGIPGGYGAVTWEEVKDEKLGNAIMGGMLATWETPLEVHLERVRMRVPAMVEHIWNVRPWPYADEDYPAFEARLIQSNAALSAYLGESDAKPLVPIALAASQGTTKGKVKLAWRSGGGGSATGFRVMRATKKDGSDAQVIAADLPITQEGFVDTTTEVEVEYYYAVVAFNEAGESPVSDYFAGSSGSGLSNIASYESFSYTDEDGRESYQGGSGWTDAWNFKKNGGTFERHETGLTYPGLEVAGGSLMMRPQTPKKGAHITRNITGKIGLDNTTMWMSYLVHPKKVGVGDFFVVPNAAMPGAIGKVWGNDFSIYMEHSKVKMKAGETYLVVARFDFGDGDKVSLWVNPQLNAEPQIESAALSSVAEIGTGKALRIQMQGHGEGEYLVDELRLGTTWASVGGLINPDDKTAPNPDPMTWIGPPSMQEDGSIFMISIKAEDPSGVQYLFECIETKKTSGWQRSNEYIVKGAKPGTYSYRVKTRDQSANKNETEWSFAGKVTVK